MAGASLPLGALRGGGWLAMDALVVIEECAGADVKLPEGFLLCEKRRLGARQIVFASVTYTSSRRS